MWGQQSSDHHSNPWVNTAKIHEGLDNLNPFNKKKKKSSKKKSSSKSKPKSSSKSKQKSTPKKSSYKSSHKAKHKTKPKSSINKQHTIQPHIAQQNKSKSKSKSTNQNYSHQRQAHSCPSLPKQPPHTHTYQHQPHAYQPQPQSYHPQPHVYQHQPQPQPHPYHSQPTQPSYTHNVQQNHAYQPQSQSYQPQQNQQHYHVNNNTYQQNQRPQQVPPQPVQHIRSHSTQKPKSKPPKPRPKPKPKPKPKSKAKPKPSQSAQKKTKPIRSKQRTAAPKKKQKKKAKASNKKKRKAANKSESENESEDSESEKDKKHKKKKQNRQNKQDSEFRSRLEADIIDEKPDISFRDVQGLAAVKLALYETIILPSLCPDLFTGLRAPTSGLLLFGPPGNGKTMIAKCVAAGCDGTFFSISASSITSKFVGDAERIMRTLFDLAREKAPSIIFIDEIDSLLTARGGNNEAESSRRIKTEFLIQFDGVKKASDAEKRVLVIGATNLPAQLDEAVLRRFGKRIMVPLPDQDTRYGLLTLLMAKQKNSMNEKDFQQVVAKTNGYSCSDLSTLCKDASMGPIRDLGAKIIEIKDLNDMPSIELKHFSLALNNVKPSLPESSLKYFIEWNDKYGSKIHLSMSALPDNMRPYTKEELQKMTMEINKEGGDDDEKSD